MPTSLFVMAQKEWECRSCGQVILSGERYWRRRLAPVCLGCHASGEGVRGPKRRIKQALDHKSGCQVNGDNDSKKGSHLTELDKPMPSPTGFLCKGQIVNGEFVPEKFYLITDTWEAQEAVQDFLEKYGLRGDLNQT